MKKTSLLLALLCLFAMPLFAQKKPNKKKPKPTPAMQKSYRIVFTQADKTITIGKDMEFEVQLKRNGGTGYSWELADADGLKKTGIIGFTKRSDKDLTPRATGPDAPVITGGPALDILHFKALKKGKMTLKVLLLRPWEKPVPADATSATFSVVVE